MIINKIIAVLLVALLFITGSLTVIDRQLINSSYYKDRVILGFMERTGLGEPILNAFYADTPPMPPIILEGTTKDTNLTISKQKVLDKLKYTPLEDELLTFDSKPHININNEKLLINLSELKNNSKSNPKQQSVVWNEDLKAVIITINNYKIIIRQDYLSTVPDKIQKINNPEDLLVLVNKNNQLPADYVPEDLIDPSVPSSKPANDPSRLLRPEAAEALEAMFADAKKEGLELIAVSGYRSYDLQKQIFTNLAAIRGEEKANLTSAYPGQSEHQTGLAMDIALKSDPRLTTSFGDTREGKWVAENAHLYGFIIRYPKDKTHITGYAYEPWHLRYIGKDIAQEITQMGLTFEEYLYKMEFNSKLYMYLN
ncbi:D-alanyl-D-alanine carboxypeptidase [Candidatus Syntrophocurvum alkaliphilum]|uniref:D-alanyl-D-alanine carboxypeptidase n=1 Tax=Candidatus Syntrophocurvum alkaliphilum TaxID=2293317 RepID=A0A6I6DKX8_9FIRM|nr:M15 family metallopeptidase [Candidatus Syntrophocurvum alkaliphilum]QGU00557.1 D-alanyl-D-alanine carboxypeptidase [Candidatus Syntrophocurvum alkaliphilum]